MESAAKLTCLLWQMQGLGASKAIGWQQVRVCVPAGLGARQTKAQWRKRGGGSGVASQDANHTQNRGLEVIEGFYRIQVAT